VRPGVGGDDPHPSEFGVPDSLIDVEIVNDGTEADFRAVVDALLWKEWVLCGSS
jgi:hypothetical protein